MIGLASTRDYSGADSDGEHGEDRRHESHLIPLIFQVALGRRQKLLIYGGDYPTSDGTCVRDYVHTEDLAQCIAMKCTPSISFKSKMVQIFG